MPISDYLRDLRAKVGHDILMMPAATAVIFDDSGQILLQRRSDNGLWCLPGGGIEPDEEPADALVREVYEETGLHVLPERIVGVYGGPLNQNTYPNGDQVSIISITFACRVAGGQLEAQDDESLDLRYFSPEQLPPDLLERHRERIRHALSGQVGYFTPPSIT